MRRPAPKRSQTPGEGSGAPTRGSGSPERLEDAARLLKERLTTVVSNSPIVLFATDAHGVFTLSEGKGLAALGLKPGEAVGRSVFEMYRDQPSICANIRRALEGHAVADLVEAGGIAWETHYSPIRQSGKVEGVIGVGVDVTERRRAEALLHQHSAAVHASMDGMAIVDAAGLFVYLNKAYAAVFGYDSPESLIGRAWRELAPAEERARLERDVLPAFERAGRWRGESIGRRRDGSTFPQDLSLGRIEEGGFVAVTRDTTARRAAEEEIERLFSAEIRARAEVEAASRDKDEFLAVISHELRTPMTVMLGWTSLLRSDSLSEEERVRAIEVVDKNMKEQAQIIEDLLDISAIVTGKLQLRMLPVDLAAVVAAAVEKTRPSADARKILIETVVAAPDCTVRGDIDRLRQVVQNLLSNAVKFTPQGGWVRVILDISAGSAVLRVADSGEGITAELLPFIFDRFRQGDSTITRAHRGLGLGLAIARHLVEFHGGAVRAESEGTGRGSAFTVILPLA